MRSKLMKIQMLLWLAAFGAYPWAAEMNGFEIDGDTLVPIDAIHSGGPPRDGIPAIDAPVFLGPLDTQDLKPTDRVLGLFHRGIAKAYPVAIMNWHEIVNDRFSGSPVVITYCPLCGSGMAFAAQIGETELTLGVSGLLYNSDVLLYDRQSGSLWSQMLSLAISGPMRGTRLNLLPLVHTTWGEWRNEHPDTQVLSRSTGYQRDYDRDPYSGYIDSTGIWFPVANRDSRYHPKERVLGVEIGGRYKAYPFSELSRKPGSHFDNFAGKRLEVVYSQEGETARVFDGQQEVAAIISFWFAWVAFHPDTEVYLSE